MPLTVMKKVPPDNSTGTYILVIYLKKGKEIRIGSLGMFSFHRGYYLYIGSAFGPGGLNARIQRHLKYTKKNHWHIDYLVAEATIIDVWFSSLSRKYECVWAKTFEGFPEFQSPVPGFGSSDCSCHSHLFYSKPKPLLMHHHNLLEGRLTNGV